MNSFAPTVTESSSIVGSGERSVQELVEPALDRAEASQPTLNAFTSIDRYRSVHIAERQTISGSLAGVTFAVKDLIDEAGLPNTRGSAFTPPVPTADAPCVSRMVTAGATPIGRTNLHEFAFGFDSENDHFGPVRNPWDTSLSTGGSSGGSAAAVAAGVCSVALGTDTGGSVRVPAALCGVYGLKVTHGRIPISGVYPLASSLDTVGPFARTVADIEAVYTVIAGHDSSDHWSAQRTVEGPTTPPPIDRITLGIPRPWVDDDHVTDDVVDAWHAACAALQRAGVTLVDLDAPSIGTSDLATVSVYWEVAVLHRTQLETEPETYGSTVRSRMLETLTVDGSEYLNSLAWRRDLRNSFAKALSGVDALLTPTSGLMRKEIGVDEIALSSGETVRYVTPISRFTALVNHVSLPAFTLPTKVVVSSPPGAIQLIGSHWNERRLLAIAQRFEDAGICGYRRPT
ncbi:MAG: amidase [Acidobacteria bacterium]|nr:amidase [Acidobacteriota bacterium]